MSLHGKLVQVARPTPENSLAQGVVGTAWLMWPRDSIGIPDLYVLEPEIPDDQKLVEGLLFTNVELEPLP